MPRWSGSVPMEQPTLLLYGKADALESEEAYIKLLSEGYSADIKVVGFKDTHKQFMNQATTEKNSIQQLEFF